MTYYDQMVLLKRMGENELEIANYVKSQEALFYKLRDDVKNSRIRKATLKKEIIAQYGDPIFCENYRVEDPIKESCLYRLPTKYFHTDTIYLYFDKQENLYSWEFTSAS